MSLGFGPFSELQIGESKVMPSQQYFVKTRKKLVRKKGKAHLRYALMYKPLSIPSLSFHLFSELGNSLQ